MNTVKILVWNQAFQHCIAFLRQHIEEATGAIVIGIELDFCVHRISIGQEHGEIIGQARFVIAKVDHQEDVVCRLRGDNKDWLGIFVLTTLPDELMLRGGAYYSTVAGQLIRSLHTGDGAVHILNTRHGGAVPGWPADWVCELPCRVDDRGIHPLPARPLPLLCDGLVHAVKTYELLAARAAATGDRAAALQALVAHPLGPGAECAPALFEDLLAVNERHLPQFTS